MQDVISTASWTNRNKPTQNFFISSPQVTLYRGADGRFAQSPHKAASCLLMQTGMSAIT